MNTYKRKHRRKNKIKIDPEKQLLLDELCEILQKLGIEVRVEPGHFTGGYCVVQNHPLFFVNKNREIDQNIELLISQLKQVDLSSIYISPKLRAYLEENDYEWDMRDRKKGWSQATAKNS